MTLRSKIAEKLNIPEDISARAPILTVTGSTEIYVENYRGIIEYGECCIRLQTKICRIIITGKNLEIVYYTNVDMKIAGMIETISYVGG